MFKLATLEYEPRLLHVIDRRHNSGDQVSIHYLIGYWWAVDMLFICIGLPSQLRPISRCFWGHPVIPAS
jgi:hypothetical protein